MEETIKERMKQFISYLGISAREFERIIGVSSGFVSSLRNGMGASICQRISKEYPALNIDWLLTGEGSMLATTGDTITNYGENSGVMGRGTQENKQDLKTLFENERLRAENATLRETREFELEMLRKLLEIMGKWKIE